MSIYGPRDPNAGCWECPYCPYRIYHDHPNGWKDAVASHETAHREHPVPKRPTTLAAKLAVEKELSKYRPVATAIARSWGPIAGLDEDDVEQEALIALMEAHVNYDPERAVPFHLFADKVIRLRLCDIETKANRQKHRPLNTAIVVVKGPDGQDIPMLELLPHRVPTPHRIAIGRETLHELADAIEHQLTPAERLAIRGVLNGVEYRDLAASFEAGERGVDNAVQRARRKLRVVAGMV